MITVREAARAMKVSEIYVRKLCKKRRLNARKVGRDWVILDDAYVFFTLGKEAIKKSKRKRGRQPGKYGKYAKGKSGETGIMARLVTTLEEDKKRKCKKSKI